MSAVKKHDGRPNYVAEWFDPLCWARGGKGETTDEAPAAVL